MASRATTGWFVPEKLAWFSVVVQLLLWVVSLYAYMAHDPVAILCAAGARSTSVPVLRSRFVSSALVSRYRETSCIHSPSSTVCVVNTTLLAWPASFRTAL